MKLKEVLTDPAFILPFNNFYNSKPWYHLIQADLVRMLSGWYGRRDILDDFLTRSGALDPDGMADILNCIDMAFMANTWKYDHLYSIYAAKYNPIWNYEGSEKKELKRDYTDAHSGKDTDTNSGTDTTSYKGSQKDTNSGNIQEARTTFDSDTDYDTNKTTDTRATTRTFTDRADELKHGKKTETDYNSTHTIHEESTEEMTRGGNMGVVSTQDMARQELELAGRLNLLQTITLDIVDAICYS